MMKNDKIFKPHVEREQKDLILLMEAEAYHAQDLKSITKLIVREMNLNRVVVDSFLQYVKLLRLEALETKKIAKRAEAKIKGERQYFKNNYNAVKKVYRDAVKIEKSIKNIIKKGVGE